MDSRRVEVSVGMFVVLGFAGLLMLAMKVSNLDEFTGEAGYQVTANFDNIGGLKVRSAVRMGGVRVGRVTSIGYDDRRYQAVVIMSIDPQHARIPVDSTASVFTAGLLGEQYIGLEAGGAEDFLAAGGRLEFTQPAVILEQLIGQFIYGKSSEERVKPN